MKNKLLLTISLCALLTAGTCAAFGGFSTGKAAYADEPAATQYPETFEASPVTDYAVSGGNVYAFAAGKKISVYGGDQKPEYYEFSENVTALDCSNGVFYYKLSGSAVYSLPDNQPSEHGITATVYPVSVNGYSYNLDGDSVNIWDGKADHTPTTVSGAFSNLKVFENVVYAVQNNRLNKITPPAEAEEIPFIVEDFSAVEKVAVGDALNLLKTYNLEKPHFATLKDGEYLTEVNLDNLTANSQTFKEAVGNTFKVGESANFAAEQRALVLCKTGNADIVALNGACYIKLTDESASARELAAPEFESATVSLTEDYAYSSPFVSSATRLFKVTQGESVTVLGKISAPELHTDFYKISRSDGETEKIGYVPCPFVSAGAGSGGEHVTKDPAYTESDMVKTVVLVILVIVLVLCAVGYIVYIFTAGRKKAALAGDDQKQAKPPEEE